MEILVRFVLLCNLSDNAKNRIISLFVEPFQLYFFSVVVVVLVVACCSTTVCTFTRVPCLSPETDYQKNVSYDL